MKQTMKMDKAALERMIEAKLRQNSTPAPTPAPVNPRGSRVDPSAAPTGPSWRGTISPFSQNQTRMTKEQAKGVCDFFRAVGNGDSNAVRGIFERADLQSVAVLGDGGYGVPEQFLSEVMIELPKLTPFTDSNIVRIVPMARETLRWTKVATRPTNPAYVAEGAQYSKSKVVFEPITLVAKKIGEIIPFTEEILESNEISMVQVVAQLVAEAFAFKYNHLVTNGAGDATEPEGILTNSAIAATTWTNTNDQTKSDSIIELFHGVASQYRSSGIFLMPDALIKMVRKLKTTDGEYIWVDGFGATPPTLLGRPVFENPDMGATRMVYGDFRRGYVIGRRTGLNTQSDSSGTDWEKDIVNFKFRERWDGRVHDDTAFAKTTVA